MPIYEYLCEGCGRITEVMHKVSERGPASCGECGSDRIARLVSRSAFQLKGGGWYADLYASKKKGDAQPAEKKDGAEKKDASEKKADVASAPATPTPAAAPAPAAKPKTGAE